MSHMDPKKISKDKKIEITTHYSGGVYYGNIQIIGGPKPIPIESDKEIFNVRSPISDSKVPIWNLSWYGKDDKDYRRYSHLIDEINDFISNRKETIDKFIKYLKELYKTEDITLREKVKILRKAKREIDGSLYIRDIYYIHETSGLPRNFLKNLF